MEKIKIGIIGCGGMGKSHAYGLLAIPEVEITGLVDTNRKNAEEVRKITRKNIPIFSDHKELLKNVELDATGIFTPHAFHYQQIMDSLRHNLHVLCEKPLVTNKRDAKKIVDMVEKKKRVLLISYNRCFHPSYRWARKFINDGRIGEIRSISIVIGQAFYFHGWRAEPELSGGGHLIDTGSHLVDLIFWLTGLRVKEVYADMDNLGTKVDISFSISFRYENGAIGTFVGFADDPSWQEEIIIWGDKGKIVFGKHEVYYQMKNKTEIVYPKLPPANSPDQNFINAIKGKEEVISPVSYGLLAAEFTDAAYLSAKLKRRVKL